MKKIKTILISSLMLLLCLSVPIHAESIDYDKEGSLVILVHTKNGTPVPGGDLKIYKVGNIVTDENGDHFELTDEFKASNADLSQPENRQVIAYLTDYAKKNNLATTKFINPVPDHGIVDFENLPFGLYLVVQDIAAPGYETMPPFLISVPNWDGEKYVYDVSAYPKSDPNKLPETPDQPKPDTPKPNTPKPPTSTQTNAPVWMGIMGISLIFLFLVARAMRKQED